MGTGSSVAVQTELNKPMDGGDVYLCNAVKEVKRLRKLVLDSIEEKTIPLKIKVEVEEDTNNTAFIIPLAPNSPPSSPLPPDDSWEQPMALTDTWAHRALRLRVATRLLQATKKKELLTATELEKGTSVAAKRWKKAYRRVIMINQVGRMKLHLATMEKKQKYEQQVAERLRLSKLYPTLDALRSPVRKPSELKELLQNNQNIQHNVASV